MVGTEKSHAEHDDSASRGIRTVMAAMDSLSADELAAIRALAEASPAGTSTSSSGARAPGEVAGFEMADHERWGDLREGATGDLYSVIAAYKQLEARDAIAGKGEARSPRDNEPDLDTSTSS